MALDFADFQRLAHENSVRHGFYEGNVNLAEKIALLHSELSELLEIYRKEEAAQPSRKDGSITKEAEEMADVFIRLMDLAEYRGIDLEEAVLIKHRYNTSRPYKHGRTF